MSNNLKIVRRRGIPNPPIEIQETLLDHYLREKQICCKIRKLDRSSPLRTTLFREVYDIANAAMEKYFAVGFLRHDVISKSQFGKNIDKLFEKKGSMLELGCGRGELLSIMSAIGWECKGVDIDTKYVLDEIKEKFRAFIEKFSRETIASITGWD